MNAPPLTFHSSERLRCSGGDRPKGKIENSLTPQYVLVYLSKGRAKVSQQGKTLEVGAGQAFQRLPLEPHVIHFLEDSTALWVALPEEAMKMMMSMEVGSVGHQIIHIGKDWGFEGRHQRLSFEMGELPRFRHMALLNRLLELVADAHLHFLEKKTSEGKAPWLLEAQQLLEKELQLTVPEVAQKLGLSYSTFRKTFKSMLGHSPGEYRIQHLIQEAKRCLEEEITITEISQRLQYNDIYTFSSQFKKQTGLSPSHWAKGKQQNAQGPGDGV